MSETVSENIVLEGVVSVHTDEVEWHPTDGRVEWLKDELGTVWCKFGAMHEDARTTCIPQLYITRVDLE